MSDPAAAFLIYNPVAGKIFRQPELIQKAAAMLKPALGSIHLHPTTGPETAGPIARACIDKGATLILAAGGDGTINEVVNGMAGSGVPLAILPAGTANVLATETDMGRTAAAAAARIPECIPCRVSVGRAWFDGSEHSRHFLLMAGMGLDAHVVYRVNVALKDRAGKLAYWLAGMRILASRLEAFEVKVDGRAYSCSFALVTKVRNYGGDFEIARDISLFDDCFEVVLFEGRHSLRYIPYLVGMALKQVVGMRGVTVMRAREVFCQSGRHSRVHMQVDGEYAGQLPGRVELVPAALTLLVPSGYVRSFRR